MLRSLLILFVALCGVAVAQSLSFATLRVYNNTNATLRITAHLEDDLGRFLNYGTVEVAPATKLDFSDRLPYGRVQFTIEAPNVRPTAPTISQKLVVTGDSVYALEIYPANFGLTAMFDAGSSAPAPSAVSSPVGVWTWPSGDPVQFHQNGGVTIRGNSVASWTWSNINTGEFVIRWNHGYTDQPTVNGNVMSGWSWPNNAPNNRLWLEARRAGS